MSFHTKGGFDAAIAAGPGFPGHAAEPVSQLDKQEV